MNVSKSGRIRKKPCKLTDFELKGFCTESQPSMISLQFKLRRCVKYHISYISRKEALDLSHANGLSSRNL